MGEAKWGNFYLRKIISEILLLFSANSRYNVYNYFNINFR